MALGRLDPRTGSERGEPTGLEREEFARRAPLSTSAIAGIEKGRRRHLVREDLLFLVGARLLSAIPSAPHP